MSVYRVIDVIGTSTQSWEDAAVTAVNTAHKSLRDLRVAEVVEQDLHVEDGRRHHLQDQAPAVLQVRGPGSKHHHLTMPGAAQGQDH